MAQAIEAVPPTGTRGTTASAAAPEAMTASAWIGIGVVAALALLFVYAFAKKRAARRRELSEPAIPGKARLKAKIPVPAPGRPPEPVAAPRREPPPPAPPTGAELAARRAAEAAEAARLEAKRLLEEAREKTDREAAERAERAREEAARAREEAEAARRKAEEEESRRRAEEDEKKREEYRAKRAAEAEEKERRRQEAEKARLAAEEEARRKKAEEEEARQKAEEEEKKKFQAQAGKTLAQGLEKTRGGFIASLNAFLGRAKVVDESVLGELEEVLFGADIGVRTATSLLDFAREKVKKKDLADADKLKEAIRGEVSRILDVKDGTPDVGSHKPHVVMVVGVNGSGKTTTIGKLAAQLGGAGKRVLLASGDTFRAAATEQLEVWGDRARAPLVKGKEGSDPGAVMFDALKRGQAEGFDVVICDTAGRLHTQAPLMEELKRVKRIMEKALPGSPHEVLLVLDATNGQNAIAQAREFHLALSVTGIVLTKLDGTAKGGVVIGICDELKLPVRYVGIGEDVGDLKAFDPKEFIQALFD